MDKREKAIKAFEYCLEPLKPGEYDCPHSDCPYFREYTGGKCMSAAVRDALEMLKAQELKQTGEWIVARSSRYATCSICGHSYPDVYDVEDWDRYCRHCGTTMTGLKCDG